MSRPVVLCLVITSLTAASPVPEIRLIHDSAGERATEQTLRGLLSKYDVSRWTFTHKVEIDETIIPHSHPVIQLHTREARDPNTLLATYLHENIHWYLDSREPDTTAAISELAKLYPDAPVAPPLGSGSHRSTYLHLITCWLENEAVKDVAGPEVAADVLRRHTAYYVWIYQQVRQDNDRIGQIVRKYKLIPSQHRDGDKNS